MQHLPRAVQRPGHDAVQPRLLPRVHHASPGHQSASERPQLGAVPNLSGGRAAPRRATVGGGSAWASAGAPTRAPREARGRPRRCGKQICKHATTSNVGNCRCRGSSSSSSRGSGLGGARPRREAAATARGGAIPRGGGGEGRGGCRGLWTSTGDRDFGRRDPDGNCRPCTARCR